MQWTSEKTTQATLIVAQAPSNAAGYRQAAEALGCTPTAVRLQHERGQLRVVRSSTPAAVATAARDTRAERLRGNIHVVIGDTQVKPGVPTVHLEWIGQYIADKFTPKNTRVIHVGDHWDMPSLSSYDKGKRSMEGRRYRADCKAGNHGLALITNAIRPVGFTASHCDLLGGNHDWGRIERACEDDAQSAYSLEDLDHTGWTFHKFLEPVERDGVAYAHYFYHPKTGRARGGENLKTRLQQIGHTFTMGHQQGLDYAIREVGPRRHHGLVVGSTYLHDERYLGPQAMHYWRGIVVCYQVEGGQYDPKFVSLDSLCRRYERKTLEQFMSTRAMQRAVERSAA
jgi:hypothetical protein